MTRLCYRISKHHKVGTSLQRGAFFFIPVEPQSDYSKFIYGSCLSMPFALFVYNGHSINFEKSLEIQILYIIFAASLVSP